MVMVMAFLYHLDELFFLNHMKKSHLHRRKLINVVLLNDASCMLTNQIYYIIYSQLML